MKLLIVQYCTISCAIRYCQGPCYYSGRDEEGHWNLGQRECWLLTVTFVQEVHVVIEQRVIVSAAYMHGEFRKWSVEYGKASDPRTSTISDLQCNPLLMH